jgi:rSAM/selenodomain-associated transferase 1
MYRAMADPVAVAILAKAPEPGHAKTRLIPALGAVGAAALQAQLIAHTVATATTAAIGPVTLWATPDEHHPAFQEIHRCFDIALARQVDGDLGDRMLAAITAAGGPVLVIGCDCPVLTATHLRDVADALASHDAVIIPAEDGGYVLIGMRRPQPVLFSGVDWGSSTVMAETRWLLSAHGLSWRELPPLWDVDTPYDLERLRHERLPIPF